MLNYLKSLTRLESILGSIIGVGIGVTSYVHAMPAAWRAIALIAAATFIFDTFTGVVRAVVIGKKKNEKRFCSEKLNAFFIKFIVYSVSFLMALCIDEAAHIAFGVHNVFIASFGILCAIAGREVTSTFENMKSMFKLIKEPWPFERAEDTISDVVSSVCGDAASDNDEEVADP